MFVTENDSSAIIVKHINYNIPWRDSTVVLIVTSTCLLPITTTPDREIVYERIRFCKSRQYGLEQCGVSKRLKIAWTFGFSNL